jgi:hypothetical protein
VAGAGVIVVVMANVLSTRPSSERRTAQPR